MYLNLGILEARGQPRRIFWTDHDVVDPDDMQRWRVKLERELKFFGRSDESGDHYAEFTVGEGYYSLSKRRLEMRSAQRTREGDLHC